MHKPDKAERNRLSPTEVSLLCEQIALILRSGLPLHDGVEAVCRNYGKTRYAAAFERLDKQMLETGSLYEGVKAAGVFPAYMAEMTQIGEKTGELDHVMDDLTLYYEREAAISRAVRNAVTYPLILIGMMAALIALLVGRVLPVFNEVFRSMGIDTASASGRWMTLGITVGRVVMIVACVLIVLALLLMALLRTRAGKRLRTLLGRAVPPVRRLNEKLSASRFAACLAMMLRSGYPLEESLDLIGNVVSDESIAGRVRACSESMAQGTPFADAVEKLGLFDPLHCRMIRVGVQAGQTDQVMSKLAQVYADEADDAISRLVSVIEPSLVALMSIIIGAILLAVMLPLLGIMSGMA